MVYQEIAESVKKKIREGLYRPGDRLPSIRKTAEDYSCNKLTVKKAYDLLKADGFLENSVGKGSFVAFPDHLDDPYRESIDFKTSGVSEVFMPDQSAQLLSELYRKEGSSVFGQGETRGEPAMIEQLASMYRLNSETMLILSGAQQGLHIAEMLFECRAKDSILFEDPTFAGAVNLFQPKHFLPLKDLKDSLSGFDRKNHPQLKAFFTIQGIHNPTGYQYSLEEKYAVIEWARSNDYYLIEDDYLSEFLPVYPPRFIDLAPERTLYVKSLSKTTAPCFRLGILCVPPALFDRAYRLKFLSDMGSASLTQKILNEFIREGLYREHQQNLLKISRFRREALESLLGEFPFLREPHPNPGYHMWIENRLGKVPEGPWVRGSRFSFSPEYEGFFRLSYMHLTDENFNKGLEWLRLLFKGWIK